MPIEPKSLRIESFNPSRHDRADFDCGVVRLNNYLKLSAKKQRQDDMTRVYVVVEEGSRRVLGYHAMQGRGLGGILLHHVIEKACNVSDLAGCHATILLDAISDGGDEEFARRKAWYGSFGFTAFASNPARMFLVMKQACVLVHARRGHSDGYSAQC